MPCPAGQQERKAENGRKGKGGIFPPCYFPPPRAPSAAVTTQVFDFGCWLSLVLTCPKCTPITPKPSQHPSPVSFFFQYNEKIFPSTVYRLPPGRSIYASVRAWRTRWPRCLEDRWATDDSVLSPLATVSSASVRISSMWQGFDMYGLI